jgi:uncharacterized protein DUF3551
MRKLILSACCLATLGAASLFGASAGQAQEYPWCAQYGGRGGGTNCGFVSFRQCMAAVHGNGGYCTQNLFFRGYGERQTVRRPINTSPY